MLWQSFKFLSTRHVNWFGFSNKLILSCESGPKTAFIYKKILDLNVDPIQVRDNTLCDLKLQKIN